GLWPAASNNSHNPPPAVTADHVRETQLRLDGRNDARQAGIAGRVAVGVVDLLEMIEVDEQHRDRQPARLGAHAGGIEPLDERAAVWHPGEASRLRAPPGPGCGERMRARAIRS